MGRDPDIPGLMLQGSACCAERLFLQFTGSCLWLHERAAHCMGKGPDVFESS